MRWEFGVEKLRFYGWFVIFFVVFEKDFKMFILLKVYF